MAFETLNTEGFLFTETAIRFDLLKADFGDGYSAAALVGDPGGLRTWSLRIEVLPDTFDQVGPIPGTAETRATYLWNFFASSKSAGNQPFWVWDPLTDTQYLAEFVEDQLDYSILCAQMYSTGVQLRQRRHLFSPIDMPGLLQWLKADALNLANNTPVSSWDASFGNNAVQTAAGKRPLFKANQCNGLPAIVFDGVDDTLEFAALSNIRVVFIVAKHDPSGLDDAQPSFLGHASAADFLGWSGTQLLDRGHNVSATKILSGTAALNGVNIAPHSMPKALSTFEIFVLRPNANCAAGNLASDRGALFFKGSICEVILGSEELSELDESLVVNYLKTKWNRSVLPLVVLDGDSITAPNQGGWADGAVSGAASWGAQISPLLTASEFGAFDLINVAKGGQKTTDILADVNTEVVSLFSATRPRKCACVMIGTNDVLTGVSAATAYANIVSYCAALKSAGAEKVLLATVIPNGSNESIRNALNASILAGDDSYDLVVELAADDRLNDHTDLTYYQSDGIHLNVTGEGVVAELFAAAVWDVYELPHPEPVSNNTLWLKADAITGASDGDHPLTPWNDSSGAGHNAVKGTGSTDLLTYKVNQQNSKPGVVFNAPRTLEDPAYYDVPSLAYRTIFVVAKYNPGTFGGFVGLINNQAISGSDDYLIIANPSTTRLSHHVGAQFAACYRNGHAVAFVSGGYDFAPLNEVWIGTFILPITQTIPGRIGWALADNTRIWEGPILEIKVFDGVLSADARHAEEAALGTKYNITMGTDP
jgi:lysophospholipase L1-like esterase